jgi:hypothetical protein
MEIATARFTICRRSLSLLGDCSPGAAIRIETDGLDAFHAELSSKKYNYARLGIETMPRGTRDMSVKDPFGNRLTFTTGIGT